MAVRFTPPAGTPCEGAATCGNEAKVFIHRNSQEGPKSVCLTCRGNWTQEDWLPVAPAKPEPGALCTYSLACFNPAAEIIPMGVAGDVHCCEGCAARYRRMS